VTMLAPSVAHAVLCPWHGTETWGRNGSGNARIIVIARKRRFGSSIEAGDNTVAPGGKSWR